MPECSKDDLKPGILLLTTSTL